MHLRECHVDSADQNFSKNDDGEFCNNAAASYASYLDSNASISASELTLLSLYSATSVWKITDLISVPAGGDYGNLTVTDPCDTCLIKNLKFQAESPYYGGPDIYSSSLYQSKTSSCGVTGMPLTTTTGTIYTYVYALPTILGSCTQERDQSIC